MDFGRSDEQRLLQETADRFVADVCPPERAKQWDDEHHYPAELFTGFADMGWFELPFPQEQGGGGGGAAELALIAEALGRASLDVAQCFILTLMGGLLIQRWGTDEMRRELLDLARHYYGPEGEAANHESVGPRPDESRPGLDPPAPDTSSSVRAAVLASVSLTTTVAPPAASRSEVARPIPPPAPVTSAVRISVGTSGCGRCHSR